jgi:hypothetical protein
LSAHLGGANSGAAGGLRTRRALPWARRVPRAAHVAGYNEQGLLPHFQLVAYSAEHPELVVTAEAVAQVKRHEFGRNRISISGHRQHLVISRYATPRN